MAALSRRSPRAATRLRNTVASAKCAVCAAIVMPCYGALIWEASLRASPIDRRPVLPSAARRHVGKAQRAADEG